MEIVKLDGCFAVKCWLNDPTFIMGIATQDFLMLLCSMFCSFFEHSRLISWLEFVYIFIVLFVGQLLICANRNMHVRCNKVIGVSVTRKIWDSNWLPGLDCSQTNVFRDSKYVLRSRTRIHLSDIRMQ